MVVGCPWRLLADTDERKKIRALMDWMKKLEEGYTEGDRKLVGVYIDNDGDPTAKWEIRKSIRYLSKLELPKPKSWWVYCGGNSGDTLRRHNTNHDSDPYNLHDGLSNRELQQVHSLCHNGRTSVALKSLTLWKSR